MVGHLLYLESNLHRIIVLQKRIVRILGGSNFDARTNPIKRALYNEIS